MKLNKKVVAGLAAAIVTVVGIGTAYAFWTTGGDGSGSATTGSPTSNLTVTGSGPSGLVPNGPAQDLALHVVNPNGYTVSLKDNTVAIDTGTVKCDTTTVPDSWFTIDSATITAENIVPANDGEDDGEADLTPSGVTLKMNDDPAVNQDVCQGAAVSFDLTVTSATGN